MDKTDYYFICERYFNIVDKTRCGNRCRYGLADCQGKIVLPPVYNNMWHEKNYVMVWQDRCRYPQVWDNRGARFLDSIYQRRIIDVLDYPHGKSSFVFMRENGRKGIINKDGEVILPARYRNILYFGSSLIVNDGHAWYLLANNKQNTLPPLMMDVIRSDYTFDYGYYRNKEVKWNYNYIPVKDSNGWFFVDKSGHRLSEKTYVGLSPMTREGFAIFSPDNMTCGIMGKDENVVLPPVYSRLLWEDNNILMTKSNDKAHFTLINPNGHQLIPSGWDYMFDRSNIYIVASKGNECSVFKRDTGHQDYYKRVLTLSNAILFLDGQYVISHDWETNAQSLFSLDGEKVFQKDYDEIYPTSNKNCIFVRQGKRWLVLDREEQVIREIFFHY